MHLASESGGKSAVGWRTSSGPPSREKDSWIFVSFVFRLTSKAVRLGRSPDVIVEIVGVGNDRSDEKD